MVPRYRPHFSSHRALLHSGTKQKNLLKKYNSRASQQSLPWPQRCSGRPALLQEAQQPPHRGELSETELLQFSPWFGSRAWTCFCRK